jgi:hypothetical protein
MNERLEGKRVQYEVIEILRQTTAELNKLQMRECLAYNAYVRRLTYDMAAPAAIRSYLDRDDVTGIDLTDAWRVHQYMNVQVSVLYLNHTIDGVCYAEMPVRTSTGETMFVKSRRYLESGGTKIACAMVESNILKDDDGEFYSSEGRVKVQTIDMYKFKGVKLLTPHVVHLFPTNVPASSHPRMVDDEVVFVQHFASSNGAHIVRTNEIVKELNLLNTVWKICTFMCHHPYAALMFGLTLYFCPTFIKRLIMNGRERPVHKSQQTPLIPNNAADRINIID